MMEWYKSLDIAWQTTIFSTVVLIIGGLLKMFFFRKNNGVSARNIGNKNNIAGGDIHTGISEDIVREMLKAFNSKLDTIGTDQSKKFASELKNLPMKNLKLPIELSDNKNSSEYYATLEKELQSYGELWKTLTKLKSSIIITPSLDRLPAEASCYDVYKERAEIATNAFNTANQLFQENRPFYCDKVSNITKELLGQCRGYIAKVNKALSTKEFDDRLHDEADELLEKVPKITDEIEKAIKIRIGLLSEPKNNLNSPLGPGLGSTAEIAKGFITYESNTLNSKPLNSLKMSVTGGYVKRNDYGKLEAYIHVDVPIKQLQSLNEKLGLDKMFLLSESSAISVDDARPTVFASNSNHILPQGVMMLNLETWQEVSLPININVQTQTKASGYLQGLVFHGKFEAILTYQEPNLKFELDGNFEIHLN